MTVLLLTWQKALKVKKFFEVSRKFFGPFLHHDLRKRRLSHRTTAFLNGLYRYGSGVVKSMCQFQHFLEKSYHHTAVNNLCESSS